MRWLSWGVAVLLIACASDADNQETVTIALP
jgi:hypothetical protein